MVETKTKDRQSPRFTGKKKCRKRVLIESLWTKPELMQAIIEHAAEKDWEITDERFLHRPEGRLPLQNLPASSLPAKVRLHPPPIPPKGPV